MSKHTQVRRFRWATTAAIVTVLVATGCTSNSPDEEESSGSGGDSGRAVSDNDDPGDTERDGAYNVLLGYEARINNPLVLVADVFREQRLEEDLSVNLVEVGLRYRLTPYALLTAGVGTGFGADSPEFRGTTGIQVELFG